LRLSYFVGSGAGDLNEQFGNMGKSRMAECDKGKVFRRWRWRGKVSLMLVASTHDCNILI
jgi:hypothetical protein